LGREYASFFVRALDKILDKDTVQYLLTLVHELLVVDPRRASYFHEVKESYAPFMAILHRAAIAAAGSPSSVDTYSVLKAAGVLGILLGEYVTRYHQHYRHCIASFYSFHHHI
jgi:hypothetical protein